jgi:hypothetical protein
MTNETQVAEVRDHAYFVAGPIRQGMQYRTRTGRQAYRIVKVHMTIDDDYAVVTSEKLRGVYTGNHVGHIIRTR